MIKNRQFWAVFGEKTLISARFCQKYEVLMQEYKQKFIYSQRLTGYLLMRGFVLLEMKPDNRNTRRNIFIFKESDKLESAISEYLQK